MPNQQRKSDHPKITKNNAGDYSGALTKQTTRLVMPRIVPNCSDRTQASVLVTDVSGEIYIWRKKVSTFFRLNSISSQIFEAFKRRPLQFSQSTKTTHSLKCESI